MDAGRCGYAFSMSTTPVMPLRVFRRVRDSARAHPDFVLAPKAALGAMLAWLAIAPLGGFVDEYPYYAPLGALAVVSSSVVTSVRSSVEVVVAILLGAAIALTAQALPFPEPIPLGLAVVVGALLAALGLAGGMGSWVPLAALFVLVAGAGDRVEYTAAYAGLTALGAVVGVLVNVVLPPLPLTPAAIKQEELRDQLVEVLNRLATALERELLDEEQWEALRGSLGESAREAEGLIAQAREAGRVNWKAARWSDTTEHHDRRAAALARLTGCVDEVIALVADQHTEIRNDDPHAADLRAATAEALRCAAALLEGTTDPEAAHEAVATLRSRVVQAQARTGDHHFAAAAITLNLEQAVAAWS